MKEIDIIVIDDVLEATALRSCLEWWNVKVNFHLIGKSQDLIDLFENKSISSKHIVFASHGEEKGFVLPELGKDIASKQPYNNFIGALELKEFLDLNGHNVLSLGCLTGTKEISEAFLENGAESYIAPTDYPKGDASLMYATYFYYNIFVKEITTEEAHKKASGIDEETGMFQLFN